MADLIERSAALREAYPIYIDGSKFDVVQVETLIGLPTVDAVPVVHGRWIPLAMNGEYKCSVCHRASRSDNSAWVNVPVAYFNYCPNCGAKMDGKDEA